MDCSRAAAGMSTDGSHWSAPDGVSNNGPPWPAPVPLLLRLFANTDRRVDCCGARDVGISSHLT